MPGPGELFMDGIIILVALWGGRLATFGDLLGGLVRRSKDEQPEPEDRSAA